MIAAKSGPIGAGGAKEPSYVRKPGAEPDFPALIASLESKLRIMENNPVTNKGIQQKNIERLKNILEATRERQIIQNRIRMAREGWKDFKKPYAEGYSALLTSLRNINAAIDAVTRPVREVSAGVRDFKRAVSGEAIPASAPASAPAPDKADVNQRLEAAIKDANTALAKLPPE